MNSNSFFVKHPRVTANVISFVLTFLLSLIYEGFWDALFSGVKTTVIMFIVFNYIFKVRYPNDKVKPTDNKSV